MGSAFSLAGSIFAAALLTSGCGVPRDKPIVVYQRNATTAPKPKMADTKGLYALFPGDGITPLEAAYLQPGDRYGFRLDGGRVVGFYTQSGTSKFVPLDGVLTSDYAWKYEGDKQP